MSYCRWSSDNWQSDIYCYEDSSSRYVIHVAGNKRVGPIDPPMPELDDPNWLETYKAHLEAVNATHMEPIGLPCDGNSYYLASPGQAADMLKRLLAMGYYVPHYAIEELDEEAKAEEGQDTERGGASFEGVSIPPARASQKTERGQE